MTQWYNEDLAYIHHQGFADYALKSSPGILELLKQHHITEGLIVELGCGSGLLTQALVKANYQVLGIDISAAMINIARQIVPQARFEINSFFKAQIPSCNAVIAVGECFNYLFDCDPNQTPLEDLLQRIYQALNPGGILLFDLIELSQLTGETQRKWFTEGEDWYVLVEKIENQPQNLLTRRIITFRKVDQQYRRDEETHTIRVYNQDELVQQLENLGFRVKVMRNYGDFSLPSGNKVILAHKQA